MTEGPVSRLLGLDDPHPSWEDEQLVKACLAADERAWTALVEKYKNMVFSIALRYVADRDDAADIFQGVWLDVYGELPKLRRHGSLRSWLISVTRNKCYHWQQKKRSAARRHADDSLADEIAVPAISEKVEEEERRQRVREAIAHLTPRCRELINMLFFIQPPIPYRDVAQRLGLAIGSIGFIRGRCLKQLERQLSAQGAV